MTNTTQLNAIQDAADIRYNYISDILDGGKGLSDTRRVRSYRFEGEITLRDAIRIQSFLDDVACGELNARTYHRLSSEITCFERAITKNLNKRISQYLAA